MENRITAQVVENLNFAAIHSSVPMIKSITINGQKGQKVILKITTVPEVLVEFKTTLVLESNRERLEKFQLLADSLFWRSEVVESTNGEIKIELLDAEHPEKVLAFTNHPVRVQAYQHWDGTKYAYTIPAFLQPNEPLVQEVKSKCGQYVREFGGTSMCGYQAKTKKEVIYQVKALYQALKVLKLEYSCAPASFEAAGQKIRVAAQILKNEHKEGTCLDLAILFAGCLEAVGLNPCIVVTSGHAFVAVWLEDNVHFPELTYKDGTKARQYCVNKKMIMGNLLPVECTAFVAGSHATFEQAVETGIKNMQHFQYAVDIKKARDSGIQPAYTYTTNPICNTDAEAKEPEVKEPEVKEPEAKEPEVKEPEAKKPEAKEPEVKESRGKENEYYTLETKEEMTKIQRLKNQAMDTSTRNPLLNQKTDLRFDVNTYEFLNSECNNDSLFLKMKEKILSDMPEDELEVKLQELYRVDVKSRKDNGKGVVYITLNELNWNADDDEKVYSAPLYLCPIEVYRNTRGEHLFRCTDKGNVIFNPVLKEFLYQKYGIDIRALKENPQSEYEKELDYLRYCIAKKKDWKIICNTANIGRYYIPNEAILRSLENPNVLKHEIVKGILKGSMSWDNKIKEPMEHVDENSVYAFPADSSQITVINDGKKYKTQTVEGPAGNGKSQTVANIIVDEIANGRKVLFVTEKKAAMDVVLSMLDEIGMDRFALSIMSGIDNAKTVSHKIEHVLQFIERYEPQSRARAGANRTYEMLANKIHSFYKGMTDKKDCGMSLEELICFYENYKNIPGNLNWKAAGEALNHAEAENVLDTYVENVAFYGVGKQYMNYLSYGQMTEAERQDAVKYVDLSIKAMDELQAAMKEFERVVGISAESMKPKKRFAGIVNSADLFARCQVTGRDMDVLREEISEASKVMKEKIDGYLNEMEDAHPLSRRYIVAKKRLAELLEDSLSAVESRRFRKLTDIDVIKEKIKSLEINQMSCFSIEERIQIEQKKRMLNDYDYLVVRLKERTSEFSDEDKAIFLGTMKKIAEGNGSEAVKAAENVVRNTEKYNNVSKKAEQLVIKNQEKFAKEFPDELKINLLKEWKDIEKEKKRVFIYQSIQERAEEIGLNGFIEEIEEKLKAKLIALDDVKGLYYKSWCEYNIDKIRRLSPQINEFNHINYRVALKRFCDAESEIRKNLRENIIDRHIEKLPNLSEGVFDDPELGRLNKLVRRRGKALPIRRFFEEAPHVLAEIMPCLLMNPEAVAEYLPDTFPEMDLVIIDEGSQLPTYKTLCVISKAKRCIIFGDENQLTPTQFFKKKLEEEDGYFSSMESILEDAIITSMPRRRLKFHYRSENEDLITFSNYKYYDGEIVTFPSCQIKTKGMNYHFVENGLYERGGRKVNVPEAEAVLKCVEEIMEQCEDDASIGVITINVSQKELIQKLLLQKVKNNEKHALEIDERVDILNLEACQGKEWDYVVLSFVYGPDKNGNISNNLGPLSGESASNRLNVMVTRGKQQMHIVTSLKAAMLSNDPNKGSNDLKEFLSYAEGNVEYGKRYRKNEHSSGLIQIIAEELRSRGYEVHTNVGSSRYKVDIAVVDKEHPERYRLGVLLDSVSGMQYNIRDEEIIWPNVLQKKGWNIYRLHSINWYESPESEIDNLIRLLE